MKIELNDKVALVTAGSKGIGFPIAKLLYECGAKISICARGKEALDEAVNSLGKERIIAFQGDIGDHDFLKKLVEDTRNHYQGAIDILVNNNGGPPAGDSFEMSEDQWEFAINRNLMSVIRLVSLVVPGMKEKKWGRIINMTSLAAKEPDKGMVLSNVTRAGVAAFSKTIAADLGAWGITSNTVLTGGVITGRMYSLIEQSLQGSAQSVEDRVSEIAETIPVKHIATPDEFAKNVLFLASDLSSYITGTAIAIDGGYSKQIF